MKLTLNVIAGIVILWTELLTFSSGEFKFNPDSIWHGRLQHVEFKDEPFLCADNNWEVESARLVCQSLGFNDAMMFRAEIHDLGSEVKLVECTFASVTDIKCNTISNCNKIALLACQLPGFEGCYSGATPSGYTQYNVEGQVTIEKCLYGCRINGRKYGALSNGNNCYCSDQAIPQNLKRGPSSSYCNEPCAGDNGQACGGRSYSSVYNTLLGSCGGSLTSDTGFITSPGFPGALTSNDNFCSWQFGTSFFNLTSISVIGAEFQGNGQLGLSFVTTEIHRSTYDERDVTFDVEGDVPRSGGGIWRTTDPITREATYNRVRKNITIEYSKGRSNAKWFIVTYQVNEVDFEIMTSTNPTSTTRNEARSSSHMCLTVLFILTLVAVTSWYTNISS